MDNLECSHQADIGKTVDMVDVDFNSVTTSEPAVKESAKICGSHVEAENTAAISNVNFELEDGSEKAIRCIPIENPCESQPAVAENELLSNTTDKTESSGNVAISHDTVDATTGIEDTEFTSKLTDDLQQPQDTFGTDIKDLLVMGSDAELPPLQEAGNVVVLYDIEDHKDHPEKAPDPSPCHPTKRQHSISDRDYVRMPYATDNWQKITAVLEQLSHPIQSWNVVVEAIKQYHDYPIDLSGLEEYFREKDACCDALLSLRCLLDLIPKIANLAVALPNVCTRPIRLLRRQENFVVAMSQYQAACLLANAFFCTYPATASCELADMNFISLFQHSSDRHSSQCAKLDCIFNYFRRVTTNIPTGVITFRRQLQNDRPKWKISDVKLVKELRVSVTGRIEKDAPNMLHVDFANKYVGGGVLRTGCVQEEMMFAQCPELIVSRLLTEVLDDNETLVVTGYQRFSEHVGYGSSFRWNNDYVDSTNCDLWGRHTTQLVAMDALVLRSTDIYDQLSSKCLKRELNKAFCGFRRDPSEQRCTVATGNWGCGAFGGDPGVKFLVQLMAASQAERPIFYFTFDNFQFGRQIYEAHRAAVEAGWTVGNLWHYMQNMANRYQRSLSSEMLLPGIIDEVALRH